jgi:phage tail-like protein
VSNREFKVQVIETDAQWKSGLRSRLELGSDGLALFLNPAFDSWAVKGQSASGDIVVDECGQTYWTVLEIDPRDEHKRSWKLVRHNPITGLIEEVLTFAGCGAIEPRELWLTPDSLWVFDHITVHPPAGPFKGRMIALSRDTYQIVDEFVIPELIDIDAEPNGKSFYALTEEDDKSFVCRYVPFQSHSKHCLALSKVKKPAAIAVSSDDKVYVLDSGDGKLVRVDFDSKEETVLSTIHAAKLKDFTPTAMQIDERGVIFIARNNPSTVYMFDGDGSLLGEMELPTGISDITGIGFAGRSVILATNLGLAKFTLTKNPIGQEGFFYSRTLDNGEVEGLWHRIALKGNLPSKSTVDVYYYASDDVALRDAFDRAINASGVSIEEKTSRIDNLLTPHWTGPETFSVAAAAAEAASLESVSSELLDLILNPNKGRFAWFKLRLKTFDQKSRPTIRSARVYYPRLSYLRYLPPAYRDDPVSAGFLERFLSIFETTFEGFDQEIDGLFRYFDPTLAPKGFLPWLASWINLSLDEDLPEKRVREFIRRAPYLYSRKGTSAALTEFLRIYSGKAVYVNEFFTAVKPLILGQKDHALGRGLALLGSGPRGINVGTSSIVGFSAVRDRVSDPDEPFLPFARRFSISISMDRNEFERRKATLERIVREQAPTHTSFTLSVTGDQKTIGQAVLGVSAVVNETKPYRVGLTQLGTASALAKGPRALRIERGAWVGGSGRL